MRLKRRFDLRPGDGAAAFVPAHYDPEGLALSPLGDIVITSEGDQRDEPRVGPRFDAFRRDGDSFTLLKQLPLPPWVTPPSMGP